MPPGEPSSQPTVDASTVARGLDANEGTWLLVDVRDPASYRDAHVRGARSVPYTELDRVLEELPRDRVLLVYAYGPESRLATWTVRDLRTAGFDAREVEGGFLELRDHGAPVERSREGPGEGPGWATA